MAEFVFMEFPFTIDEIQIAKYVLGTPNVGDDQWIYETGWTSKCFFDVSDWLTLAGPDNPYPNGTYDDLFIDNTGVYNRYYPWVDAPLPPEGSLVYLTGMYVEEGFWTPGINQQWGNPNGVITDGTDAAGYARFSVPYVHTYGTNEPIGWPNPTLPASASHELRQQNQGVEGPAQTIPRLKNTGRPPG